MGERQSDANGLSPSPRSAISMINTDAHSRAASGVSEAALLETPAFQPLAVPPLNAGNEQVGTSATTATMVSHAATTQQVCIGVLACLTLELVLKHPCCFLGRVSVSPQGTLPLFRRVFVESISNFPLRQIALISFFASVFLKSRKSLRPARRVPDSAVGPAV
jgi:hypothetical protein